MNTIKAKRRLNKTLKRRGKAIRKDKAQKAKDRVDKAFWNIFKNKGIVQREWQKDA